MYDWRIAFTGMKWKQTLTNQEISSRLRIGLAQNVGGVDKSGNKYAFFFYSDICFINILSVLENV